MAKPGLSLLRLPELAPGMDTATLATWLKKEGDSVSAGEPVAEIETDKTSVELEAPCTGTLAKIHVAAGSRVTIGALLAELTPGEATAISTAPTVAEPTPRAEPVATSTTAVRAWTVEATAITRAEPAEIHAELLATVPITPLAARMAALAGLDAATIPASSADGRIRKVDVEALLGRTPPGHADARATRHDAFDVRPVTAVVASDADAHDSATGGRSGAYSDTPLTAMRRTTAARLTQAKQTIPHFYLETTIAADALVAARAQVNAARSHQKLSVTDFLLFAATQALREVPAANAAWVEGGIRVFADVDIAVAVNTPKGLVTPVIRRCQEKSLGGLSRELRSLASRAREGILAPSEYTGGTFTISNLGMYAVTSITPIVNPPQCAILGVGAIEARPVVSNGTIVVGQLMQCTLAADHRVIDGATGAEWLTALKRWLEDPLAMALRV